MSRNRPKLHSVTYNSELKVGIDEKNLEFITCSGKIIFKDVVWDDMYRSRVADLDILFCRKISFDSDERYR